MSITSSNPFSQPNQAASQPAYQVSEWNYDGGGGIVMAGHKRKRTPFECIICMISYKVNIPHSTTKCDHSVCRECVRKYFNGALKDHRYTSYETVECPSPGCNELFVTQEALQAFFTQAEIKRWWNSAILKTFVHNKVHCPLPGCKAVFDADIKHMKQCTFSECYECRRGFCIACQSAWHPGVIKIINDEEDVKKTLKKAETSNWTRCPKCDHLVEKVSGCTTMRCACGTIFCYRCGGFSIDHYCVNRCQAYSLEELSNARKPMFDHTKKPRRTV